MRSNSSSVDKSRLPLSFVLGAEPRGPTTGGQAPHKGVQIVLLDADPSVRVDEEENGSTTTGTLKKGTEVGVEGALVGDGSSLSRRMHNNDDAREGRTPDLAPQQSRAQGLGLDVVPERRVEPKLNPMLAVIAGGRGPRANVFVFADP